MLSFYFSDIAIQDMQMLPEDLRETPAHRVPRSGHPVRGRRLRRRPRFPQPERAQHHSELLLPSQLDRFRHHGTVCHTGSSHNLTYMITPLLYVCICDSNSYCIHQYSLKKFKELFYT